MRFGPIHQVFSHVARSGLCMQDERPDDHVWRNAFSPQAARSTWICLSLLFESRRKAAQIAHSLSASFFSLSFSMRNSLLHFWQVTTFKKPTFKRMPFE